MIRARYYGKRARRFIYKIFKSRASFNRARRGLAKRRIRLKQTRTPYFRRRRIY